MTYEEDMKAREEWRDIRMTEIAAVKASQLKARLDRLKPEDSVEVLATLGIEQTGWRWRARQVVPGSEPGNWHPWAYVDTSWKYRDTTPPVSPINMVEVEYEPVYRLKSDNES